MGDAVDEALTLFVDDVTGLLDAIQRRLVDIGFRAVAIANSVEEALGIMRSQRVKHVITDWRMPDDGLEFAITVRESFPSTECTVLTGFQEELTNEQRDLLDIRGVKVFDKADINTAWLAELVGYHVPADVILDDTMEDTVNDKIGATDVLVQQRLRIEGLENELAQRRRLIDLIATDLVEELRSYPNLDEPNIVGDREGISVADLLRQIEKQSPEGLRLLELDRNVRRRLGR
jgi:CheY-like chemotaxis protein